MLVLFVFVALIYTAVSIMFPTYYEIYISYTVYITETLIT